MWTEQQLREMAARIQQRIAEKRRSDDAASHAKRKRTLMCTTVRVRRKLPVPVPDWLEHGGQRLVKKSDGADKLVYSSAGTACTVHMVGLLDCTNIILQRSTTPRRSRRSTSCYGFAAGDGDSTCASAPMDARGTSSSKMRVTTRLPSTSTTARGSRTLSDYFLRAVLLVTSQCVTRAETLLRVLCR
jgi:hypothetical protein